MSLGFCEARLVVSPGSLSRSLKKRSVKLHALGQMVKRGLDRQLTLDNRMAEVAKIEGIKVEGV